MKNNDRSAAKADPRFTPGSEEQHLDMLEGGDARLRGDEVLHNPPEASLEDEDDTDETVRPVDELMNTFSVDMSEDGREGDEMSGDDHSSGMQGGESELLNQENIESGMPGQGNDDEDRQISKRQKRRAA